MSGLRATAWAGTVPKALERAGENGFPKLPVGCLASIPT